MTDVVEHYKNAGKIRYTMILTEDMRDKLVDLAKSGQVTQGEVVETLMEMVDQEKLIEKLQSKRAEKVETRTALKKANKKLLKKFVTLSEEQIAALEKL